MVMPRRKRNNKQEPFYAFRDGRIYAANRKARRISTAKKVVIKETEGETNANNDGKSL